MSKSQSHILIEEMESQTAPKSRTLPFDYTKLDIDRPFKIPQYSNLTNLEIRYLTWLNSKKGHKRANQAQ